jgi:micrococcal nuclease
MRIIWLLLLIISMIGSVLADSFIVKIDRVYDGDTAMFTMPSLPNGLQNLSVRLLGIDAPEMRSKCSNEQTGALLAKQFLVNEIEGKIVTLHECTWDKYGGRLDCIVSKDGQNINQKMLDKGLVVRYNGTKKSHNWCKI